MRALAVLMFVAGVAILVYQMLRVPCPKQKIEYKFLPRDLDLQMRDASQTYSLFRPMFEEESVGAR